MNGGLPTSQRRQGKRKPTPYGELVKLRRLARRRARRLALIALGLAAVAPTGALAHNSPDDDDDRDRTADLALTLSGSAPLVQAGDSVAFTTRITNMGPRDARFVRAVVLLTGQIGIQQLDAPGWSCDASGSIVNCFRRSLRHGAAATITVTAMAPLGYSHVGAGAFVASARLRDPNIRNNGATDDIAINNPPVAVGAAGQTAFETPIQLDVLHNDYDPDGDPIGFAVTGLPSHGTVVCDEFACLYTPAQGYSGPDSFEYTLADDRGGSAIGHVTIAVTPPPPAPPAPPAPPPPLPQPDPTAGNSAPGATVSGPTVVTAGQTGGYTTIISDGCKVAAENVVVRITLPAGATVISAPSRSVLKGRILTIPIGTIRAGTPRGVGVRLRFGRKGGALRPLVAAVRSSNGRLTGDGLVINVR